MTPNLARIRHQGPVLAALGRAVGRAAVRQATSAKGSAPTAPTPWIERTVPPPPDGLIRDFVRFLDGDPATWRGLVPPHLFPQWAFPFVADVAGELPYPLWRVLNAGCRLEIREPLPAGRPLEVAARLERIDADERRVLVTTRVRTGTADAPDALLADVHAFVPLRGGSKKEKREPEIVPPGARELARWRLPSTAGLDFACLTGDVNPIHWLPPYARAFGFPSVILHGFGSMALAAEALVRTRLAGEVRALKGLDVRFTKPLVLPAAPALFIEGDRIAVGDAPGGPAILVGTAS